MSVVPQTARTRAHVFIREEQKSSTEAKDNKRSLRVKQQQVHSHFTSQVFPYQVQEINSIISHFG